MAAKKKAKAAPKTETAPDPREPLPPTPANLAATMKQLKSVLAGIPLPDPIEPEPEPESEAPAEAAPAEGAASQGSKADAADSDGGAAAEGEAEAKPATQKKDKPKEVVLPKLDLVDALLHIYFAQGLPCGYGQEAIRRIADGFVDRNEFRVTEAFEVEELMSDLGIPDTFDRCLAVRESIAQVYNDQNGVQMSYLREAGISDRKMFFQRVPAVQPHVVTFLDQLLTIEEVCFSEKSTLRAQQRFGFDPKNSAIAKFVDELRALVKPYGQLPLTVGSHGKGGKPNLEHTLSPACLLVRLAPPVKRRK